MRKLTVLMVVALLLTMVSVTSVSAGGGAVPDPLCAGSLPNILTNGQRGQIAQRFSTLRPSPYAYGTVIYADTATAFTVVGDPVCAGYGPVWWIPIRYDDGQEGWAAESQVYSLWGWNQYWLEPIFEESAG